jgi:spore maturation protein CgeB
MNILYCFNKSGFEASYWTTEIAAASDESFTFIPFNHIDYLDPRLYVRAQRLDDLFHSRDPRLLRLYRDFEALLARHNVAAMIADTAQPFHPDYLKTIDVYKVLRTGDGPIAAYDRDIPYVHAYDHVLFHSPAYSAGMTMAEKLRYCGARRYDFWPLCVHEAQFDNTQSERTILNRPRDIDVVFVGALHFGKMPLLAKMKKALGRKLRLYGAGTIKRKVYFHVKYGCPGWVRTLPFEQYVRLYQRSKIGINVHNRGDDGVGNYRLFELPANGVMQISDGGEHLKSYYDVGTEVVGYSDSDELIEKVNYYLTHEEERRQVALNGFRRVLRDYRHKAMMHRAADLIFRRIESERSFGFHRGIDLKVCTEHN